MNKQNIRTLFKFTKNSRGMMMICFLSVILAEIFAFIAPFITSNTLDAVLGQEAMRAPKFVIDIIDNAGGASFIAANIWIPALLLVGIMSIRGIFMFFRGWTINSAAERTVRKIRNTIYKHLQKLSYEYHVKAETGDLIQRSTTDVETVRRFLRIQLVDTLRVFIMLIIAIPIMVSIHWKLAVLSVILIPLMIVFSYFFFKKIQSQFTKVEEADGHMSTVLQENLSGVRVVRAFGRQKFENDKYSKANIDLKNKTMIMMRYFASFYALSDMIVMGQRVLGIVFGVYFAAKGEISVGDFVLFNIYLGMMLWPIRQFGRILADMGKTLVAIGRIDEILNVQEETSGENPKSPLLNKDIVFKNVHFGYDKEHTVLEDISFDVKAGQTIAILGATGSGKSTMMHLLQRLYDYDSGSITIGGVELSHIDKHHLRSRVGLVLQEPFLFSKTVKENIGITQKDQNDDEIFAASRVACVHDVIESFEKGYDTIVGEKGVTLSGGQKQRVAIARTVIRDCDILIFDDSLSAVDTQTDAKIRNELKQRRKGVTTFIISHRVSTLMEADKIIVLEDGKLAEIGSHRELKAQPGLYKRIWDIQNALEAEEV